MAEATPWTNKEYGLLKRAIRLYENQLQLAVQCEPELAKRGYDSCRSASRRLRDDVAEVEDTLRIDVTPESVFEQITALRSNPASRAKIPNVLTGSDTPNVYETVQGKDVKYVGRHLFTEQEMRDHAGLSREEWECTFFKVNNWQQASVDRDSGAVVVTTLYQTDARFKPSVEYDNLKTFRDQILSDIEKHAPAYPAPNILTTVRDPHMLELAPYDWHIGKLGWGKEIDGESFDSHTLRNYALEAVEDALAKSRGFPIDKIIMPIGNDLFHADTPEGTTTAGTRQDMDSRPGLMHARAEKLMVDIIDRLMHVAPVEVLVVPGNHDHQNAFWLGRVLSAWYRNTDRVAVDTSPTLRKYRRYGITLLGFTHGKDESPRDLPLIMARERPREWAECEQFEFHTGHFHKKKETVYTAGDEFNGVRVRVLPSLSGTDFWHYQKGYVKGRRAMESFLWSKTTGYVGHFSSNIIKTRADDF